MAFASVSRGAQPSLSLEGATLQEALDMLSSVPIGTLQSGDVAFISNAFNHTAPTSRDNPYWMFLADSSAPTGATVVLADGATAGTKGRWVQLAITFETTPP